MNHADVAAKIEHIHLEVIIYKMAQTFRNCIEMQKATD